MGQQDDLVHLAASGDSNGLLDAQSDEAGEEERTERVDMEGDEVFSYSGCGVAKRVGDEAVVGVVGVPGKTDEDCQREERIHIHDAVDGGDLDAGADSRASRVIHSGQIRGRTMDRVQVVESFTENNGMANIGAAFAATERKGESFWAKK